jgi:hypothetical protein
LPPIRLDFRIFVLGSIYCRQRLMGVRLYRFNTRPDVLEIARKDRLCCNALQCPNGTEV